jgi:hypothetical protein
MTGDLMRTQLDAWKNIRSTRACYLDETRLVETDATWIQHNMELAYRIPLVEESAMLVDVN